MTSLADATLSALADYVELAKQAPFSKLIDSVDNHAASLLILENNAAQLASYHMGKGQTAQAKAAIERAWHQGFTTGRRHAFEELKMMGRDVPGRFNPPQAAYLKKLQEDIDAIPVDLAPEERARRAAAAASVATNRAYSQAQLTAYKLAGIEQKVWVTHFSATTCPSCAALHGQVIESDSEFGSAISFGTAAPPAVYHDLAGPPRHPHCRCRLVAYDRSFMQDTAVSPATMQAFARTYAESRAGMAPRSWAAGPLSKLARTTQFLTSADIRNIPESRFLQARRFFRACLTSVLRRG